METNVRTPMDVFNLPQHLVVPLLQRAYVWDETEQWLPLWDRTSAARRHFRGSLIAFVLVSGLWVSSEGEFV